MEIVAFTPAAALLLATLASQHALTEDELLTILRATRATGPATITVDAIEDAIAAVIETRATHAA